MNHTATASPELCGAKGSNFDCVSQRDQLWRPANGDRHGDFNPACTNSTSNTSAPPTVPPRWDNCSSFDKHQFKNRPAYNNTAQLGHDGKTWLEWTVNGDDTVTVKMTHHGIAGYLAVGIVNPGGGQ